MEQSRGSAENASCIGRFSRDCVVDKNSQAHKEDSKTKEDGVHVL
jgi:hypothetical protein